MNAGSLWRGRCLSLAPARQAIKDAANDASEHCTRRHN